MNPVEDKCCRCISFIEELEKIESFAEYFNANIGPHRNNSRNSIRYKFRNWITWFCLIFLWFMVFRVLLCLSFIDNEFNDFHVYFGDLAFVYAPQKYRLFIDLTILTWTSNATIMYTIIKWDIITKRSSFFRKWLCDFESLWNETAFTLNKSNIKNESKKQNLDLRKCGKLYRKIATSIALIFPITCSFITFSGTFMNLDLIQPHLIPIQIMWCFFYIFWCGLTMLINSTCLAVHLLFCKALIIRFREIYDDLKKTL
jgi:hypothetical protein